MQSAELFVGATCGRLLKTAPFRQGRLAGGRLPPYGVLIIFMVFFISLPLWGEGAEQSESDEG